MQFMECSRYFSYANIRVSENEFDVTWLNVLQIPLLIVKSRKLGIIKTSNFMIPK